ncbi:hypothetical protein [Streptomyces lavendulae]|uniref:hypothetical protein n=1 Tax=Streptomyces lavendulae TaxID=1914 RepID=UPI0024A3A91F|nr:hypothetical protein [Streptomyces lavendulae]GLW03590.1 hypothetical protein Slala05_72200 [Streptomyces lavendulae subsp. lavendulae]
MDISSFISEDFGSVVAGGAALLAIPGVIVAGAIQGKRALQGAQAQAEAALRAAHEQAAKALEAAQAQAQATLETGRLQAQATLEGVREMSREAHAQWRDRCEDIRAAFVAELDLLKAKEQATSHESEMADLLKAYAMVELMSPPVVLEQGSRARNKAIEVDLMLFTLRMQARDMEQLELAKQRLRSDVTQGSGIADTRGLLAELVPGPDGDDMVDSPGSPEEYEDMRERFERCRAASDALEALAAVERAQGVQDAGERARQTLLAAGFRETQASSLVFTAQLDRDEQQQILAADKRELTRLRNVFVKEARKELDALGA